MPTEITTDDLPDGVPLIADFNHYYNKLSYYYPRLVEAGVNVPETIFIPVESTDPPQFDEGEISEWMIDNSYNIAFVRSEFASAKYDLDAGSKLLSQDRHDIRQTVSELFRQHILLERPIGGTIAVREFCDLTYCPDTSCTDHYTEVRYFIRDGEVLYHGPSRNEFVTSHSNCDKTYSYIEPDSISLPTEQAELVADEFDELAWSVDFVRDAQSGKWYCTDMGLDGVYWHEKSEEYVSISGHWNDEYSPENYIEP